MTEGHNTQRRRTTMATQRTRTMIWSLAVTLGVAMAAVIALPGHNVAHAASVRPSGIRSTSVTPGNGGWRGVTPGAGGWR